MVFGQHAHEAGVVALDRFHSVVDHAADHRLPAAAFSFSQRAAGGTQKTFAARYSSRSSGSAPDARSRTRAPCFSSKASEMYMRKRGPRQTCFYSAALEEPSQFRVFSNVRRVHGPGSSRLVPARSDPLAAHELYGVEQPVAVRLARGRSVLDCGRLVAEASAAAQRNRRSARA